jgi:branched-chain amino acid transport system permease protein
MQAVIDSLVSIVTGVFTLGEADLITIGINMIMGLSMFLPMTVGQLSFGQAGFMSIGAHIAVVLTLYAGVSFPIALLAAGLGSGLVGFLVGVPVLRLRGLLLALVTFAFAQVVEVFFLNFKPTGAAEGIRGIFPYTNLWYVYGFLVLLVLFLARLRRSRMGRAFDAVKLDETAAEATGIDVTRAKLTAFAAGAFVAGIGGGLYAHHAVFIQYDNFDFKRSVDIAMYMVLGGMDVLYGPLLGAFVITYLSTALQFLADWRWEVWGSIVILVMIFRPQGILGRDTLSIRRWLRISPVHPGVSHGGPPAH